MKELRKEQFGGSNYALYKNDELVERYQLNKRELRKLMVEVDAENAEEEEAATPTRPKGERYLALASLSTELNTGKAWVCNLSTVERTSCPPEWEGQLVCYVYPK